MDKPKIIVMVPVRNEAWSLRRFLQCTLLWADHVIVADQGSTDGTVQIARSFPQVTVVANQLPDYSEVERQRLLIQAARQIPGPRLLMALDADEILSANVLDSLEWQTALTMPPGTQIELAKIQLAESPDRYFLHSSHDQGHFMPFGYVDDGAPHEGTVLHTCRVPDRPRSHRLRLNEVVLLHYSLCNGPRNASKDRWYRCFERLTFPHKTLVQITRLYDWYERLKPRWSYRTSPPEWFANYRSRGLDLTSIEIESTFWWDWDILRMFKQHGLKPFQCLDIWDYDWESLRQEGLARGLADLPDFPIAAPDNFTARAMRKWLRKSRHLPLRPRLDQALNWALRLGE